MGLKQARMGSDREVFPRFGMAHFVKQHRRHQHGIDMPLFRFAPNERLQLLDSAQCVAAQGLELVDASGEQLGEAGLGAMDPKPLVEGFEFRR
jgi:hypothetical protein